MVDSITDSMDMNVIKLREVAKDREVWPAADHGVTKSQTGLSTSMNERTIGPETFKNSLTVLLILTHN